jgi:hypothetical protein
MKNPHFTPAEEAKIAQAERMGAKAEMLEAGVAEFLKNRMPADDHIAVAIELLQEIVRLRAQARAIHGAVGHHGRKGKPMRAKQ